MLVNHKKNNRFPPCLNFGSTSKKLTPAVAIKGFDLHWQTISKWPPCHMVHVCVKDSDSEWLLVHYVDLFLNAEICLADLTIDTFYQNYLYSKISPAELPGHDYYVLLITLGSRALANLLTISCIQSQKKVKPWVKKLAHFQFRILIF